MGINIQKARNNSKSSVLFIIKEGCFLIAISKTPTSKLGETVALRFILTQHQRDIKLLELIKNTLGCGYLATSGNCVQFKVTKYQDIKNIIIPIFKEHNKTVKFDDYLDFCKASELMDKKAHLTKEGLDQIKKLKSKMNRGRKKRWAS